ncbi:MAG: hypothetical protein V3U41_10625 [candidate division NC10 bacterium]
MTEHRVLENDRFQLVTTSSIAQTLFARVVVRYDNGIVRRFSSGARVTDTTRVPQTKLFGLVGFPGVVERAQVVSLENAKRGETFVELATQDDQEEALQDILLQDYIHNNNQPSLGRYRNSLEGPGLERVLTLADDQDGDNPTSATFNATNTRRVLKAIILYWFASSDVATRAIDIRLGRGASAGTAYLGTLPTGFAGPNESMLWLSPALSLAADEEGLIFISGQGGVSYGVNNDNGTPAYHNRSTAPSPLPLLIREGETLGVHMLATSGGQEADKYSAFALVEEWLEI